MDGPRFEVWLRSFATTTSRRRALVGLGGLAVGAAIGVAPSRDARATRRRCQNKPDGTRCHHGECLNGKCKHAPACDSAGALCGEGVFNCCSGLCAIQIGHTTGGCTTGSAGAKCRVDADCQSNACLGFHCQA